MKERTKKVIPNWKRNEKNADWNRSIESKLKKSIEKYRKVEINHEFPLNRHSTWDRLKNSTLHHEPRTAGLSIGLIYYPMRQLIFYRCAAFRHRETFNSWKVALPNDRITCGRAHTKPNQKNPTREKQRMRDKTR